MLCVTCWLPSATLDAETLETIPLHHRLAEELVPLLQPLLPPGAALTGTGDVLLVRADAATLRDIRNALETLDRAPRELVITVGQATGAGRQSSAVAGSATVESGDVQVGVNRPPAGATGAQVVVRDRATRDDIRSVSTVRALEGHEVYLSLGESRPFTSTTVVDGGPRRGGVVTRTTGYRDALSGFHATPRLDGDRVTLVISPAQQHFADGSREPQVATRALDTTVSGRLGEWIELGGISDDRNESDRGLATWGTRAELTQYSAWVKVDAVR
jgi:type II secretory pathway component GspD/PulD (secretin)